MQFDKKKNVVGEMETKIRFYILSYYLFIIYFNHNLEQVSLFIF
jgi:hypothetical protein